MNFCLCKICLINIDFYQFQSQVWGVSWWKTVWRHSWMDVCPYLVHSKKDQFSKSFFPLREIFWSPFHSLSSKRRQSPIKVTSSVPRKKYHIYIQLKIQFALFKPQIYIFIRPRKYVFALFSSFWQKKKTFVALEKELLSCKQCKVKLFLLKFKRLDL